MTVTEGIYLYLLYVVLAFVVDLLPFMPIIKKISGLSLNSVQIIKSETLDDSEKESALLANSFSMFRASLTLFGLVILLGAFTFLLLLPIVLFKVVTIHLLLDHMATWLGIFVAIVAFVSYFLTKKIYVKIRL
jgi:hypothetical protein